MDNQSPRNIAKAHRLVLVGCVVTFVAALIPLKYSVIAVVVACYATWVISRAMHAGTTFTIAYLVLAFIPVINILALVSLSLRATRLLKVAGVKVGPFGVRTADLPAASDVT